MDSTVQIRRNVLDLRVRHAAVWAAAVLLAVALAAADGLVGLFPQAKVGLPPAHSSLTLLLMALGCEFVDATIGMGYGTTITPLLLLMGYPVTVIVPSAVLSQLGGNLAAAFFHHHVGNVDFLRDHRSRNVALVMGGVGLAVSVASVFLAVRLPPDVARIVASVIILSVGVFLLVGRRWRLSFRWRNVGLLAAVAAFNKAVSGGGYGPLVAGGQVLAGLPVRSAVANTALAEAVVCVSTVVTYLATGTTIPLAVLLPLLIGSVLSAPASAIALRRLPVALARAIMGVAVFALGLLALLRIVTA